MRELIRQAVYRKMYMKKRTWSHHRPAVPVCPLSSNRSQACQSYSELKMELYVPYVPCISALTLYHFVRRSQYSEKTTVINCAP